MCCVRVMWCACEKEKESVTENVVRGWEKERGDLETAKRREERRKTSFAGGVELSVDVFGPFPITLKRFREIYFLNSLLTFHGFNSSLKYRST